MANSFLIDPLLTLRMGLMDIKKAKGSFLEAGMKLGQLLFVFLANGFVNASYSQIPSNPKDEQEATSTAHTPGSGVVLVSNEIVKLDFSVYATMRYLNQKGLDQTYVNATGDTNLIDRRNDLQFQKVMLYFKGWWATPKFRYIFYAWTSNTSQGLGAQVVLGGNFQYQINKHVDLGGGIGAIPSGRSLIGSWPSWHRQDCRPMADEFFRASFTTGIWVQGEITKGLYYKTMLGNNLSQLGIDAGQLDDGFDTWGSAIWWVTNRFGRLGAFGDFDNHEKPATILGIAFTRSNETRQSQPGTEDPENTQIRLSDGTGVFSLNAFGDGTQVLAAKYQMTSFNGGVKFKGLAFDVEYYIRNVSDFETIGQIPVTRLFDQGVALQGSGMVVDKTLQLYSTYSYIDGEYGNPSEFTVGLNWYVKKNKWLRINPEVIFVNGSPVGYLSYPTTVGASGNVFMINLELYY